MRKTILYLNVIEKAVKSIRKLDQYPELLLIQLCLISMVQHCPWGKVDGFYDNKGRLYCNNLERDRNRGADIYSYLVILMTSSP
jgi:hypothetical protein